MSTCNFCPVNASGACLLYNDGDSDSSCSVSGAMPPPELDAQTNRRLGSPVYKVVSHIPKKPIPRRAAGLWNDPGDVRKGAVSYSCQCGK